MAAVDLKTVLIEDEHRSRLTVPVLELSSPASETKPSGAIEIQDVSGETWEIANRRLEAIKPLISPERRTRWAVEQQATNLKLSPATLYRWIALYERTGNTSALIPGSGGGRGKTRLEAVKEHVIKRAIDECYLTRQKASVQSVVDEVRQRCVSLKVQPPHANTIRKRISSIDQRLRLQRREGRRALRALLPHPDSFRGAEFPLSVVQIDHTKLDMTVVSDETGEPIGKPWITLAIDVFSRMVTGYYVSLDPPGALSTGLCLAHSILPKDEWLLRLGVSAEWPCWGLMQTVHADNAMEFRGKMLARACQEYGINLHWRPVGKPEYGGHIERLLGTLARELHKLPGTTFSNVRQKGEYESDRHATLTLRALDQYIATYITGVYHQRIHSSLKTTPLKRWEEGILGSSKCLGRGLPERVNDPDKLQLDFMPQARRTVQPSGVVIEHVHYYHDVLRNWIGAKDEHNRNRKFIFKRNPRDISAVYFYNPDQREYRQIPYRDTSLPAISVWELRRALKELKDQGKKQVDETAIFQAHKRLRELVSAARRSTKQIRRKLRYSNPKESVSSSPAVAAAKQEAKFEPIEGPIEPYEDLELE